jgi:integrase
MPDRRRYRKPLVTFEFGTRIYSPSEAERRYRIIAKDPSGGRIFQKFASEDEARARARQLEAMLASSVILPSRGSAPTTVAQLTELYAASLGSRSTRYAERQKSLLRHWVTPVIGDRRLVGWTPADSERVLDRARQRLAPATVQNVGACMRALVTFAYKNRWLARESDPMWLVRYSAHPDVQGQAVGFIPRASLPTDQDCQRFFDALESLDQPVWALAMRLKHRSGARWGELIALRPVDLDFEPQRVLRIHRAVEQSARGMSIKTTKNRQQRVSTFPASLVADLRQRARDVDRAAGPQGLLFPGTNRGFANRRIFQRTWIRGAQKADWPMRSPTSAVWHPHDLRHVAACWLLFDVGLDPAVVSALLGHANAAFTLSRYVGVRGDLTSTVTIATDAW